MRKIGLALLYTALAGLANLAAADPAALNALREGDMRKLTIHSTPQRGSEVPFQSADGAAMTLDAYAGQHVVLNFWATWCAPCRKEMPELAKLQDALGGEAFQVVTVATGRNSDEGMRRFFEEIGVDNLPLHKDPQQALARDMGVLGLPITVILNPQGQEVARLQGDADWSSDSAMAIVTALMNGS
jgi:thiol-disulfide isomerase/thioredoxin